MLRKFKNNQELSKALALYIVKNIKRKKSLILGCPGGRSLKNTYKYIGIFERSSPRATKNKIFFSFNILYDVQR